MFGVLGATLAVTAEGIHRKYRFPNASTAWQVKFGPDVEWVSGPTDQTGGFDADGFDYRVDPARSGEFAEAIRRRGQKCYCVASVRARIRGYHPQARAEEFLCW